MDVKDGAQAALVKALEEADMAAVGDPGLRAVEKSGQINSPIDMFTYFGLYSRISKCSNPTLKKNNYYQVPYMCYCMYRLSVLFD